MAADNKFEGEFTDTLAQFLKECQLVSYYPKFKKHGYDDLEQLKDMTAEELNEVMMLEWKKIKRTSEETGIFFVYTEKQRLTSVQGTVQGSSKNSDVSKQTLAGPKLYKVNIAITHTGLPTFL